MQDNGLGSLLEQARRREPAALAALVEAYAPRVFGLLFRLTGSRDRAEEMMQETFLRVVRTIDQYEDQGRFEAWLFRIAANLAKDEGRRLVRRGTTSPLEDSGAEVSPGPAGSEDQGDPAARLIAREDTERLAACIAGLSDAEREIIVLRHYAELSFKEIADLLGIPLGTALARAHRALAKLRSELSVEGVHGERTATA